MSKKRPPMKRNKMDTKNLVKLMSSLKKYLPLLIIAAILLIGNVAVTIIAPDFLSDLTDEIATPTGPGNTIDFSIIKKASFTLVGLYLGNTIFSYVSGFLTTTVTQRYSQALRKEIESKINRLPLAYFDSHPFGETLSTITNDVDTMSQSIEQGFQSMVQGVFMLVAVVVMMFVHSWQMALAAIASLPLMLLFTAMVSKKAMPAFKKRQDELAGLEGVVEETYSGLDVINAFSADEIKEEEFEKGNTKVFNATWRAQIFGGLFSPFSNFAAYFANASVLLVGGLLIANKDPYVTFGTLTAFLVYVRLFQEPLSNMGQAMNSLQMAAAASKRVFDFLGEGELADESDKQRLLSKDGFEKVDGKVDFINVNFSYDSSRVIIPDFSAWVEPGMKVAIVGPTGAGKTTMVNLLMRFYETNSGSITIDGVPIKDMSREELRDIFGMVLQDTWIFKGSIRENLVYNSKWVSEERLNQVVDEANLRHFVDTLPGGLDYVIEDENSLSGGQKQLITIARAMIRNSPMMILDEATSNVDTRTEEAIQESMDRLTQGRTSFVIAHRLSTIRNADLILVMKDGNIIEKGTHESLLKKNGFYAGLYNSQFSLE